MIFTPAAFASSAAAAAAVASCGQMMITLTPWLISASTLAFSLALSPWLNRGSQPAFWNTAWSCSQRGSSFVGNTTPTNALFAGAAGAVVGAGAAGAVVGAGAAGAVVGAGAAGAGVAGAPHAIRVVPIIVRTK